MAKTICSSGKETLEKHFLKVNDKTRILFKFSIHSTKYFVSFVIISLILPFRDKNFFEEYCFK